MERKAEEGPGQPSVMKTLFEPVDILQAQHQSARSETWSRRSYNTGVCSMRVDMINAWREEMRDQASVTIASLDNLMVVSTLMLSCGYGFAVEGTFPPKEEEYDYGDLQQRLLVLYSLMASLSLAFPFVCLLMAMLARSEFDVYQYTQMEELQHELRGALQDAVNKTREQAASRGRSPHAGGRMLPAGVVQNGSRARALAEPLLGARGRPVAPGEHGKPTARSKLLGALQGGWRWLFPQQRPTHLPDGIYRRLTRTKLVGTMKHFDLLYDLAQACLRLGMLCSIVCCTVLLGIVFYAHFPETPWMWRIYSGLLCCSFLGVFAFCSMSSETQIALLGARRRRPPDAEELPRTRLQREDPGG